MIGDEVGVSVSVLAEGNTSVMDACYLCPCASVLGVSPTTALPCAAPAVYCLIRQHTLLERGETHFVIFLYSTVIRRPHGPA
jgi:hypothetical protein